jgi:hypothetical protein
VTLKAIANRCNAGECPTVYKTNRATIVVQGYSFDPKQVGVSIPADEQMVEIPMELIEDLIQKS